MARIEALEEWFFPAPVRVGSSIVPAPWEAVKKRDELRSDWLMNYRGFSGQEPSVSLSPGKKDDQPGYFVRKETIRTRDNEDVVELMMANDWLN